MSFVLCLEFRGYIYTLFADIIPPGFENYVSDGTLQSRMLKLGGKVQRGPDYLIYFK